MVSKTRATTLARKSEECVLKGQVVKVYTNNVCKHVTGRFETISTLLCMVNSKNVLNKYNRRVKKQVGKSGWK